MNLTRYWEAVTRKMFAPSFYKSNTLIQNNVALTRPIQSQTVCPKIAGVPLSLPTPKTCSPPSTPDLSSIKAESALKIALRQPLRKSGLRRNTSSRTRSKHPTSSPGTRKRNTRLRGNAGRGTITAIAGENWTG
ncbi:hypothetical protein XELAEV_18031663mg [Xenopus laevis]|uniref:Uncharacterized protein n=1 Tax=Xenopus laevis TaxID=8355 RepID=A0A974CNF1_XENLA|nr:hypothetical protein XELAEV_18031663mg [Xenopus laevis]